MPLPSREEILDICQVLAEQEQLNATYKGALKGFMMAGAGAALGTILGGPIGLFIGGSVGSGAAAYTSKGKFKSVVSIIKDDMTPSQRQRLADSVLKALQSVQTEDLIVLLPMVLGSDSVKGVVLREIGTFITREMGMVIQ